MPRSSEAPTRRLQPVEDLGPTKRLSHAICFLISKCGSISVWLLEMIFTLRSSGGNSLKVFLFGLLLGRSDSLRLVAVVEKFFPVIDVVAKAGFDPTGDDVRVCSCVLSFVDSTDKRIQLRVVNVLKLQSQRKSENLASTMP